MFDFVRTHNKLFFFILVVLILPAFVVTGLQSYGGLREGGNATVASVDGKPIKQVEWDAAHRQQAEQVRRSVPAMDPKMLDTPEMKQEALERLVRERVMLAAAEKQRISTNDEQLTHELMTIPQLKQILGPDGKLDMNQYRALLQAQGLSAPQFEASLRQETAMRTAVEGPAAAVPSSATAARVALEALLQRREVQVLSFDSAAYASKVNPTDEDVAAYHKANADTMYRTREQAQIEYVVLDATSLKGTQAVNADEVRAYYDQNTARFTSAEERQASHILIKSDSTQPPDKRATAKAQAEKLLVDARKSPEQFAALAKQYSQDEGSAKEGGDLGFFGRQAMVKPFEDTVYAMKAGEISNVVETDFGYHIIKLTGTKGGEKQPFDTVKSTIESELRLQQAQKEFAKVADQFGELAYSQADSLEPLVEKMKLTKQKATVGRVPDDAAVGPLKSAKLLEAVFSNEAVREKRNTPAVETGTSQLTVARIVQHEPSRVQPLEEVKARVRAAVVSQQAAEAARKAGEARLAKSKVDNDGQGLGAAVSLSRVQPQGQPQDLVKAVMSSPAKTLPQWVGVDLGNAGYAVVRINSVAPPAADSPEVLALAPRYQQAWAQAQSQGAYESIKKRLDAKILVKPEPAKAMTDRP
jgi:peptidyl-prolyl cis-trans isomerase D